MNNTKENRKFVDDILYRNVKVPLGIDYPCNWDEIVDFCYNDIMETSKDFSDMNIAIAFRRFLEKDKTSEVRFYLVNSNMTDLDVINCTDEEFMEVAEEQGSVYTSQGFTNAFNGEDINSFTQQLRIITV